MTTNIDRILKLSGAIWCDYYRAYSRPTRPVPTSPREAQLREVLAQSRDDLARLLVATEVGKGIVHPRDRGRAFAAVLRRFRSTRERLEHLMKQAKDLASFLAPGMAGLYEYTETGPRINFINVAGRIQWLGTALQSRLVLARKPERWCRSFAIRDPYVLEAELRDFLSKQPAGVIYLLLTVYRARGGLGPRGFLGTYEVVSDRYTPAQALDQLLGDPAYLASRLYGGFKAIRRAGVNRDFFLGSWPAPACENTNRAIATTN